MCASCGPVGDRNPYATTPERAPPDRGSVPPRAGAPIHRRGVPVVGQRLVAVRDGAGRPVRRHRRDRPAVPGRGFGSVRVEATIGATVWRTSVFPDRGSGCYVLPLKQAVRKAEGLLDGDPATVTLRLVDL
ncbi:MAG: DUF1905 domain-containing protein [Acidimicrobiales bacterium]